MFDFGFWELTIVMVIALLVIGPERLPALAGQIGKWVGKAKRMIASVRSDIESEIKAAELKEMLKGTKNEIEKELDFEEEDQGDRELIRAVENHIESTKQQELSLNSEKSSDSQKHDDD